MSIRAKQVHLDRSDIREINEQDMLEANFRLPDQGPQQESTW